MKTMYLKKTLTCILVVLCASSMYAKEMNFSDYLSKYKEYKSIDEGIVLKGSVLPSALAVSYLPMEASPCSEGSGVWNALARWESNGLILAIARRDYDLACSTEKYPWSEYWIVSYTKKGEVVDYCPLGRWGDRYLTEVKGNGSLSGLVAIQASVSLSTTEQDVFRNGSKIPCSVAVEEVTMDSNGHFMATVISQNEPGNIVFDEKTTESSIQR